MRLRAFALLLLALPALAACAKPPATSRPAAAAVIPPADLERLEPRFRVELQDGGRAIAFLGEVTPEASAQLQALMARTPDLQRISLTSPGGDLASAIAAGDAIARRRLRTEVPLACISACTLLFAAGETRVLAPDARLGFHSAIPAKPQPGGDALATAFGNDLMSHWLVEHGVAATFLEQVLAIPHERVWYPSAAELRRAGLLSGKSSQEPSDAASLIDWVYLNDPLLQGLNAAYPADYAALRQQLYAAFRAGADDVALEELVTSAVGQAMQRALPVTSDAVLLQFFQVLRDLVDRQRAQDPRLCNALLAPSQILEGLDRSAEREFGERMGRTLALAFFSVARAPAPPITRAAYDERWQTLGRAVWDSGQLRDSDRGLLLEPGRDPERFCQVALIILDSLLTAPAPDRAAILRGLVLFP